MAGDEVIRQLRQRATMGDIYVAVVTADVFADEAELKRAGVNAVLTKPFDQSEFFELMKHATGAEYDYESVPSERSDDPVLTVADLSDVPRSMIDELLAATVEGDIAELHARIKDLPDPLLVAGLGALASEYKYEELIDLFESHRTRASAGASE
jgi:CheY-like chemotaxis protein